MSVYRSSWLLAHVVLPSVANPIHRLWKRNAMQTFDTLNQVIAGPVACICAGGRILMRITGRKQVRVGERVVNRVQIYKDVFQAVREWQGVAMRHDHCRDCWEAE